MDEFLVRHAGDYPGTGTAVLTAIRDGFPSLTSPDLPGGRPQATLTLGVEDAGQISHTDLHSSDGGIGEPLTPALGHRGWGRITDVAFNPTGDRFVTASADGTAQVWRLDYNDWSPDDLEQLAEQLGGSRIGADAGSLVPLDARALHHLWDELRTRHPNAVDPSP
jgi:WD40 repeat protein